MRDGPWLRGLRDGVPIALGYLPVGVTFGVVATQQGMSAMEATLTSIIVYSGGRETMPIQIYKLIDSNLMAPASAYGLVLVAVILVPIIVATRVFKIDLFSSKS